MDKLPDVVKDRVSSAAKTAIEHAFTIALKTLSISDAPGNSDITILENSFNLQIGRAKRESWTQGLILGGTGALGGFLGTAGTIIEIPISTSLIMRDMLRSGISFGIGNQSELIAEALYLFTYGSDNPNDDAVDSAYFSARLAFQELIRESGHFIAAQGSKAILESLQKGSAPILIRLITKIAARFNVPLTEKVLAQSMPIVGALGGATINSLFADYYHKLAFYHFGIKNLELRYGTDLVQGIYLKK
jgi:hypothetical protein